MGNFPHKGPTTFRCHPALPMEGPSRCRHCLVYIRWRSIRDLGPRNSCCRVRSFHVFFRVNKFAVNIVRHCHKIVCCCFRHGNIYDKNDTRSMAIYLKISSAIYKNFFCKLFICERCLICNQHCACPNVLGHLQTQICIYILLTVEDYYL